MAPELIDSDPERSADLDATRANVHFFATNMGALKEDYGGQYVVVHDQAVVAAAERSDEAWAQVEARDIDPDRCVMQYVPEPGRAFFF